MAASIRIPVNYNVIKWSIEHGEKTHSELIKNYPWIENESPNPTFKQLQKFSEAVKIPFYYFTGSDIPTENFNFVNFRTVNNDNVQPSRRLIETVHEMESRQEWYKDYVIETSEREYFKFHGILQRNNDDYDYNASLIRPLLDLDSIHQSRNDIFYKTIRHKISKTGVIVMQNGIVGTSTSRALNVDEFRAFALDDDIAPLIFINAKDSQAGKIFSLIHEFIHVLLGENEILNVSADSTLKSEQWINNVTAATLLPKDSLSRYELSKETIFSDLSAIAKKQHVSIVAAAIRLKKLGIINQNGVDIALDKQSDLNKHIDNSGKSDAYQYKYTVTSRLDPYYANAVINYESVGKLSILEAAKMLGTNIKNYKEISDTILKMRDV